MTGITIRKAEIKDMHAIYQLVYDLAVFEKEPESMQTNAKAFEEAFEEKLIDIIAAEVEGEIIGIALFYMTFSTWRGKCLYLEDFYVKPDFRKYGIGQQLFDSFISTAKSRGAKQVKWQVLDWNETGLNFYKKNNATIEKNWWNGKILFD
jgi:GNAT superfamily N-acetyltransferase